MLGNDPEFFIFNNENKPVPAWKFFPPQKEKVAALTAEGDASAWYFRDGYAVEINTVPGTCREQMTYRVHKALRAIIEKLPPGYTLKTLATIRISEHDLKEAPPDGQVFGCKPSINAYTGKESVVDLDAMSHPFRYAGGHMHHSYRAPYLRDGAFNTRDTKLMFVKLCDLFIGLPFTYLYSSKDEKLRRKYYGRAGECRLPTYSGSYHGVEYRVPSPKLWNNHCLASMFFGVMRSIVAQYEKLSAQYDPKWEKPIQDAINNCCVPLSMIQTVSGFYTPALIDRLKRDKSFSKFTFLRPNHISTRAFTEYVHNTYPKTSVPALFAYEKVSWGIGPSGTVRITNPLV